MKVKVILDDLIGFGSFPEVGRWDLEGIRVSAEYMGAPVKGVVVESRVQYGGNICHKIDVEEAFELPVIRISREAGEHVIVDQKSITGVLE